MTLFRRTRKREPTTDYHEVTELVRKRRREQRREPGQFPSSADPKQVRTYHPSQRLDSLNEQTQQLVENAKGMPHKWDSDWSYSPPHHSLPSYEFAVILVANILAEWFFVTECVSRWDEIEFAQRLTAGGIGFAAVLAFAGYYLKDNLPLAAQISWYIASAEALFFIGFIGATLLR